MKVDVAVTATSAPGRIEKLGQARVDADHSSGLADDIDEILHEEARPTADVDDAVADRGASTSSTIRRLRTMSAVRYRASSQSAVF